MKWTEIISIIEARSQPKFPILPCYQQFSDGFNQTPQPITYDKLMKENFENTFSRTRFPLFEDAGHCGIHRLAYYRSFHRSQHDWGIYIIDAGVDFVAKKIMELDSKNNCVSTTNKISPLDAEYLAKHKLLLHELGHHATEIVHSVLETDSSNPRLNSYRKYIAAKKSNFQLHDNAEAVCNWNVKKKKRHFKIRAQNYYGIARNFMLNQPDGYKHFENIAPRNYLKKITMLPLPQKTESDLTKQFTIHSRLNMVKPFTKKREEEAFQVPIYLIRTGKHLKK